MKYRLKESFPGISFKVIGEPRDIGAARQLATEDRYQFQWWALSLIPGTMPVGGHEGSREGKKGSDKGIDGILTFIDDAKGRAKRALVQVKSGHVNSSTAIPAARIKSYTTLSSVHCDSPSAAYTWLSRHLFPTEPLRTSVEPRNRSRSRHNLPTTTRCRLTPSIIVARGNPWRLGGIQFQDGGRLL